MTHEDSQTEKLVSEDAVDKRGWQQRRWRTDSTGKKGVREVQVLHPGLDVSVMSAKRRVTVFTPLDESSNWLSSDQLDICWSRSVGQGLVRVLPASSIIWEPADRQRLDTWIEEDSHWDTSSTQIADNLQHPDLKKELPPGSSSWRTAVASQAGPASAHGRQEEMQTPSGSTRLTQNAAEALVAAPKGDRPVGRKDCDDAVMDSSNSGLSELSQASCSTMATSQEDSGHAATLPGSFRERYRHRFANPAEEDDVHAAARRSLEQSSMSNAVAFNRPVQPRRQTDRGSRFLRLLRGSPRSVT